jgi:hypothetical protein
LLFRSRAMYFFSLAELHRQNAYSLAYSISDSLENRRNISKRMIMEMEFKLFDSIEERHVMDKKFSMFIKMRDKCMLSGQELHQIPFFYDWAIQKNNHLSMYVVFRDSLYHYGYKDTSWLKPDYPGLSKMPYQPDWTLNSPGIKNNAINDQFRYFLIRDTAYFLANADTVLYQIRGDTLQKIGVIEKEPNRRLLYLVDKDQDKVFFLRAKSVKLKAGVPPIFEALKPDDPLYQAVEGLIKMPMDPKLKKGGG